MTAWVPALLNRFQAAFGRLGSEWSQVAQKALAAGMAYWIASSVLGHDDPAFASIAALISLAVTTGKEGSQVVELVFGVACGLTVADLLLSLIGSGALQIALVVGLATGLVTFFGGGALSITEAGVSALLMVILASPSSGMSEDRTWSKSHHPQQSSQERISGRTSHIRRVRRRIGEHLRGIVHSGPRTGG
jgi:hypothetical protein